MKEQFTQFCEELRLTPNQQEDAKTKYTGVIKTLHKSYYDTDYNGSTKLLFGSYRTKTNIRPMSPDQDVDVIFKIPKETFEKFKAYTSNGPSALLQEIKEVLEDTYTTSEKPKGWGKVVLVKFADNTHNVEVLPAFEEEDGTFTIPNSENGGSWDSFDPRDQVTRFQESNTTTDGLTADLTRMLKRWLFNVSTIEYKPYQVIEDVFVFLEGNYSEGAGYSEYSALVKDFFTYLSENCPGTILSHVTTALARAEKAVEYEDNGEFKNAADEWRKIFGNLFPQATDPEEVEESSTKSFSSHRTFSNPSAPYAN